MNYSPIIVPVVVLTLCFLLFMFGHSIAVYRRAATGSTIDWEEMAAASKEHIQPFRFEHLPFCVVCFALASMGAGSGWVSWLAWLYVASWVVSALPRAPKNVFARRGTSIGSYLTLFMLIIYAGFRVAGDIWTALI